MLGNPLSFVWVVLYSHPPTPPLLPLPLQFTSQQQQQQTAAAEEKEEEEE